MDTHENNPRYIREHVQPAAKALHSIIGTLAHAYRTHEQHQTTGSARWVLEVEEAVLTEAKRTIRELETIGFKVG